MRAVCFVLGLVVLSVGCNNSTEPVPSSPAAATTPAKAARAFHYDVVATITEGATKTKTSFSLDLADGKTGSSNVAKNLMVGTNARSDVGTRLKASLAMEGDTPKLDVDLQLVAVDAAGKIYRVSSKAAAVTPLGKATTILALDEAGKHIELSVTPSAGAELGAEVKLAGPASLDILASAGTKSTSLTAAIAGDAAVVASKTETVPLQATDGGVGSPRQDTGTRVKVSGTPRTEGMALDFDLEMSAVEPATPAARIRKITATGRALVPYEKATPLFAAEEDGQPYTVTVTLHRPK